MNDSMKSELATLIASNYDNVEAAFSIIHNLEAIKEKLLLKLKYELQIIADDLKMKLSFEIDFINEQYNGAYFFRENWKLGSIAFGFQSYSNILLYEILVENPEIFPPLLHEELVKIKPNDTKTSEWWPIFRAFESPYNNWDNSKEVWTSVADGSMAELFKNKLIEMLNLLDRNNIEL